MKLIDIIGDMKNITYILHKDECEDIITKVPMCDDLNMIEMYPIDTDYYDYESDWIESYKNGYYFKIMI